MAGIGCDSVETLDGRTSVTLTVAKSDTGLQHLKKKKTQAILIIRDMAGVYHNNNLSHPAVRIGFNVLNQLLLLSTTNCIVCMSFLVPMHYLHHMQFISFDFSFFPLFFVPSENRFFSK